MKYYRRPTESEIKFGQGCLIWSEFNSDKKWIPFSDKIRWIRA